MERTRLTLCGESYNCRSTADQIIPTCCPTGRGLKHILYHIQPQIEKIYDRIHDAEEQGQCTVGWIRAVYPTRKTAEDALNRKDLFAMKENGQLVATAIINCKKYKGKKTLSNARL